MILFWCPHAQALKAILQNVVAGLSGFVCVGRPFIDMFEMQGPLLSRKW